MLGALAILVIAPFVLRPRAHVTEAELTLVVVTPHNEAIRHEFGAGFARWYHARTGRTVRIDWRTIGGAGETVRYIRAGYAAAFEQYWRRTLRRDWQQTLAAAALDERIVPDGTPEDDTPTQAARRAFLDSNVGIDFDVFFGGGPFEFARGARAGWLVDAGLHARHPDWFTEEVLPANWAGEELQDPAGRWYGAVLSTYGMLANRDVLARRGAPAPTSWRDLTRPELIGEVALADPTRSASVASALEMVVQEQMQRRLEALRADEPDEKTRSARAVREGWIEGLRLLQLASANARYFTDSSQKVPIDVAQGDAGVGICIDFFGRFQEETLRRREGEPRVRFVVPRGGTAYTADPIGMLRGAPRRELAADFIEFVLSLDGQRLWNQRVGSPGGPEQYALRRLPARRDYYGTRELQAWRSDPDVDPYDLEGQLLYRSEWTGGMLRELAFVVRVAFQDPQKELSEAWAAVIAAGRPAELMAQLGDLSAVDYDRAIGEIRRRLAARDRADEMRLATELTEHFRQRYREIARTARH
ncbi:MAG: extracellular solute-binding protein [Opitutaceae bacterium]